MTDTTCQQVPDGVCIPWYGSLRSWGYGLMLGASVQIGEHLNCLFWGREERSLFVLMMLFAEMAFRAGWNARTKRES